MNKVIDFPTAKVEEVDGATVGLPTVSRVRVLRIQAPNCKDFADVGAVYGKTVTARILRNNLR